MSKDTTDLESLNLMILEAFGEQKININLIKQIIFKLKLVPQNEKHLYFEAVEDFLNKSFEFGYEVENLSLADFEVDQNIDAKIQVEVINEKIEIDRSIISFKDLFDSVTKELIDYFINYKGYFITQLINDFNLPYELIFVYEDFNSSRTLQSKVKNLFDNVIFYELEDEQLPANLDQGKNYICIFLLTSKVNNLVQLADQIRLVRALVDKFNNFEYHTLTNYYSSKEKKEIQIVKSNNSKTRFIEDIKNFSSMFLSNMRLNFEEEKIIKKMCSRIKSGLIFYRILAGGFSGSKVIEVRPKKLYDQKKIYILKIGHITDKKVSDERDNYDEYIPDGMFDQYNKPNFLETELYEGLMYDYAISKEANSSHSFSDHFDLEKFPFLDLDKMKSVIVALFDNELFDHWRNEYHVVKTSKVSEIYGDYLSKEKIISSLKSLLNDDKKENEFLALFDKIWEYSLKYSETVCHGDLHTDNFFIDDTNKIFLIDFGHTKKRHSLIDYVALECSLKFKHFPFYLEREELEEIESLLLTDITFDFNYNFKCSRRKDILDFLGIINAIRNCAKVKSSGDFSFLEYQIALFILTVRQIKYENMNQRYAYHSAKMIGLHIVDKMKL